MIALKGERKENSSFFPRNFRLEKANAISCRFRSFVARAMIEARRGIVEISLFSRTVLNSSRPFLR